MSHPNMHSHRQRQAQDAIASHRPRSVPTSPSECSREFGQMSQMQTQIQGQQVQQHTGTTGRSLSFNPNQPMPNNHAVRASLDLRQGASYNHDALGISFVHGQGSAGTQSGRAVYSNFDDIHSNNHPKPKVLKRSKQWVKKAFEVFQDRSKKPGAQNGHHPSLLLQPPTAHHPIQDVMVIPQNEEYDHLIQYLPKSREDSQSFLKMLSTAIWNGAWSATPLLICLPETLFQGQFLRHTVSKRENYNNIWNGEPGESVSRKTRSWVLAAIFSEYVWRTIEEGIIFTNAARKDLEEIANMKYPSNEEDSLRERRYATNMEYKHGASRELVEGSEAARVVESVMQWLIDVLSGHLENHDTGRPVIHSIILQMGYQVWKAAINLKNQKGKITYSFVPAVHPADANNRVVEKFIWFPHVTIRKPQHTYNPTGETKIIEDFYPPLYPQDRPALMMTSTETAGMALGSNFANPGTGGATHVSNGGEERRSGVVGELKTHLSQESDSTVSSTGVLRDSLRSRLNSPLFITQGREYRSTDPETPKGRPIVVFDPSTGEVLSTINPHSKSDITTAITEAHAAFQKMTKNAHERAGWLMRMKDLVLQYKDILAGIIVGETGKLLLEANEEVQDAVTFLSWFAQETKKRPGTQKTTRPDGCVVYTERRAIGVVAIMTPWQFPLALIVRKVAQAIAAGCTVVIRPSAYTPHSALAVAYLAEQVGIPRDVIHILLTREKHPIKEPFTSPLVRAVSITTSERAIRKNISAYDREHPERKRILDPCGNAYFIVFSDANIELAVSSLLEAKFRSSCIGISRIFVHVSIIDEFLGKLVPQVKKLKSGDPFDPNTTQGPLENRRAVKKCARQVRDAVEKGAEVCTGNHNLDSLQSTSFERGYFFQPTVLRAVRDDMLLTEEKSFGPIVTVWGFETEQEVLMRVTKRTAIAVIAGYIFTKDAELVRRVSERLDVRRIAVNTAWVSEPGEPDSGLKVSHGMMGNSGDVAEFEELRTRAEG